MAERSGKTWTPGELGYLQDRWGSSSIKNIAKKLGRSVTAVKLKANRIGLEDIRLNVNGVTPYQLSKITKHDLAVVLNWLDRYGLPYRVKVTSIKKKYRFINIDLLS